MEPEDSPAPAHAQAWFERALELAISVSLCWILYSLNHPVFGLLLIPIRLLGALSGALSTNADFFVEDAASMVDACLGGAVQTVNGVVAQMAQASYAVVRAALVLGMHMLWGA